MRVIDLSKVRELLAIEGLGIAQDLSGSAPKATGKLKEGYTTNTVLNGSFIVTTVSAADHHKWVVGGRGPNKKRPPLDVIREWCRVKGIPIRAAWPIATKIAEKGIKPKPLLQDVLRKRPSIEASLAKIFGDEVRAVGEDLFKSLFPQKAA